MVWVDHNLVIDMWSSLNVNNEMSGFTEFGRAGGYYNIKVLYAADTVGQGIELKWETEGQTKDLMASEVILPSSSYLCPVSLLSMKILNMQEARLQSM